MTKRISVSSAEFIRNIGYWQNEALRQPISITHHGRERLILAATDASESSMLSAEAAKSLAAMRFDFAAVQEHLTEAYLSLDAELRIRASNAASEALLGAAREDMEGASISSALPEPLSHILADRVQRVMQTREAERFEFGAPDERHLAGVVFPVASGAAVLLRNLTEINNLRRKAAECDALSNALKAQSIASTIRLDTRGRVTALCDNSSSMIGGGDDAVGEKLADLVAKDQRRDLMDAIEQTLRTGVARSLPVRFILKNGGEIAGVLSLAAILNDFIAEGMLALFVPSASSSEAQRAA